MLRMRVHVCIQHCLDFETQSTVAALLLAGWAALAGMTVLQNDVQQLLVWIYEMRQQLNKVTPKFLPVITRNISRYQTTAHAR
jgi:hypothetical protein